MDPGKEKAYRDGLNDALQAGFELLAKGGSSLDAVLAAVISLENNILFNAGKGSVFTSSGHQEMDAAIMDGSNLAAGAVAGVRNIRNPIELAYTVMTKSPHVILAGEGANEFAKQQGLKTEPDEYFFSEFRKAQWEDLRGSESTALDHGGIKEKKFGTVGAVACDQHGNIAAATSTGGMTNKQFGRIGDSPLIGAGTYANNRTCAISCTGHGEPFIRAVTAYDVSCLMEYAGLSLREAMDRVVNDKLVKLEGEGGMIGIDAAGNTEMIFNSDGMYRGSQSSDGTHEILIYR
jgi:beta-aspartyl-peptidase (threonine type)